MKPMTATEASMLAKELERYKEIKRAIKEDLCKGCSEKILKILLN